MLLRVLAGADAPLRLADIAAELRITTKEDRADLALERSLAAMVKDASVMAAVRAYGALREAIARYKS